MRPRFACATRQSALCPVGPPPFDCSQAPDDRGTAAPADRAEANAGQHPKANRRDFGRDFVQVEHPRTSSRGQDVTSLTGFIEQILNNMIDAWKLCESKYALIGVTVVPCNSSPKLSLFSATLSQPNSRPYAKPYSRNERAVSQRSSTFRANRCVPKAGCPDQERTSECRRHSSRHADLSAATRRRPAIDRRERRKTRAHLLEYRRRRSLRCVRDGSSALPAEGRPCA